MKKILIIIIISAAIGFGAANHHFILMDDSIKIFKKVDLTFENTFVDARARTGMPFFHRTPDLVAYLNDGASLTTKSDVFQLGLVVTEIFTGWNPERPAENLTDPIALEKIKFIPGVLGKGIRGLIESMLEFDPDKRQSASEQLDSWEGIFHEVVTRSQELNGWVF